MFFLFFNKKTIFCNFKFLIFFKVKNDVAVIYTRDMVKKMTRHCHVGDSADSRGRGSILKNLHISRMKSNFIFFTGVKPKSALYYRGQKHY